MDQFFSTTVARFTTLTFAAYFPALEKPFTFNCLIQGFSNFLRMFFLKIKAFRT
jgi:hypothetical protein